jgi:hypothetical protein
MNKIVCCIIILSLSFSSIAQSKYSSNKKYSKNSNAVEKLIPNELRINMALSIYGIPELSYERYFNDNFGAGVSASATLLNAQEESQRFKIVPYARIYFGEQKKAAGFFFEVNSAAIWRKNTDSTSMVTNIAFGGAIGVKMVVKNNFIGEVYAGGGRKFGKQSNFDDGEGFLRIGVCVGKRY